jgi:hypothetical protein
MADRPRMEAGSHKVVEDAAVPGRRGPEAADTVVNVPEDRLNGLRIKNHPRIRCFQMLNYRAGYCLSLHARMTGL